MNLGAEVGLQVSLGSLQGNPTGGICRSGHSTSLSPDVVHHPSLTISRSTAELKSCEALPYIDGLLDGGMLEWLPLTIRPQSEYTPCNHVRV